MSSNTITSLQKITPCLWFNFNAEEAVQHYVGIFKRGKILETTRYNDAMPQHKGKVMTILFELEGQQFMALNGGPAFQFTEAISLMVACDTQAEIDDLYGKLLEGGQKSDCGWLKDKFGLSWQITPRVLLQMIHDPDPAKATRAMQSMMTMQKLDIARLQQAYEGR